MCGLGGRELNAGVQLWRTFDKGAAAGSPARDVDDDANMFEVNQIWK